MPYWADFMCKLKGKMTRYVNFLVELYRTCRIIPNCINCIIILFFSACNVGDEGGFAPNIQNNLEG